MREEIPKSATDYGLQVPTFSTDWPCQKVQYCSRVIEYQLQAEVVLLVPAKQRLHHHKLLCSTLRAQLHPENSTCCSISQVCRHSARLYCVWLQGHDHAAGEDGHSCKRRGSMIPSLLTREFAIAVAVVSLCDTGKALAAGAVIGISLHVHMYYWPLIAALHS